MVNSNGDISANERKRILLEAHFSRASFVQSDIESFNKFVEEDLAKIAKENNPIEPTIIPPNVDDFKIMIDSVKIGKPMIVEADGSEKPLFPQEARIRNLTYGAPIYLSVSSVINGKTSDSFETEIGVLPIMLKSKFCLLNGLSRDELIEKGEDPDDPGGYFIINGTERIVIKLEDLAQNCFSVERNSIGPGEYRGRIFSEYNALKIAHSVERYSDGIIYFSFARVKKAPFALILKALGMISDQEIVKAIDFPEGFNEIVTNLYETSGIKNREEALDRLSKIVGITQSREIRIERSEELLDNYFLPHLGTGESSRMKKAVNTCKYIKKYLMVMKGKIEPDDKDHYKNKRLKMPSDLLGDLFRANLRILVNDMLYNFQRIVKRGKFPAVNVIIREKLLSSRINSAMATGNWVGGRKGVSQRVMRWNYFEFLSHLQRVVSPLSTKQENFEARNLHSTHLGRLCPVESPEGTSIGLKKNLALLASVSKGVKEEKVIEELKSLGMKEAW
ncbi:MAG: DNA-directed polymerase subunit [Candidatus Woesearchaeota archaeon]|nr:DNA-directed polymerase subunit [Candidatus Woesearchaeota archaeon]